MSAALRSVLVVANQRPYPPLHGGTADAWRIITALRGVGVVVHVVSWREADWGYEPSELGTLVDSYLEFPVTRPDAVPFAARHPTFVGKRNLTSAQLDSVVAHAREANVDVVLSIGLYGGRLAQQIHDELHVPLVYRAQSIESLYFRQLYAEESALRFHVEMPPNFRARRTASAVVDSQWVAREESRMLRMADLVLDISADDLQVRVRSPEAPVVHVPPIGPESASALVPTLASRRWDVGYVGNLFVAGNQNGLFWFLDRVLPLVRRRRPDTSVVVAGKTTTREVVDRLRSYPVDVLVDPPDALSITKQIRVGINPIFAGNGTTVKTLDMLWSGCAVVTTPVGVQGYSFGTRLPLVVAFNVDEFANATLAALASPHQQDVRTILPSFEPSVAGKKIAEMLSRTISADRAQPTRLRNVHRVRGMST